ncbi:TPA: CTP synthase [Candidatus Dependentiae bacterium]|nr:MAG: hypothetical protein UR14_C0005G0060 [candidate division TM6 bacterium GW2011_GWE2_31_21]KKP53136.1 MAG: hypothetical protein UR43_C0007G0060 [candidate division TM6 bacterium GW2011_GWF2_33_332]HBS47955.1 CTP synthase [Candidatus Dependentiae bacterium]HBZ73441.1 CTP synthase [Candidatus Dependentiae bacterium]
MTEKNLLEQFSKLNTNFIVVTGGVCSSIGKGILVSSIGTLLKNCGKNISIVKMDPYLNVDPGTMSPLVHGEVFVTQDGAETDMDLGHYERTLGIQLTKESSVSAGQIFQEVLDKERAGYFLGKCIQLVPHVVDAIKGRILSLALKTKPDYLLIEIGGTVGDIEGEVFLEAIRQLRLEVGYDRFLHAHLSYVPYLEWANEFKTKPTQHSIMFLKKAGIVPDAIFLRVDKDIDVKSLKKLSLMCGVSEDLIFTVPTRKPVFRLFLELNEQKLAEKIQQKFQISKIKKANLSCWENLVAKIVKKKKTLKIGFVAKYVGISDPYISIIEALNAAALNCDRDIEIVVLDAEKIEQAGSYKKAISLFKGVDGILVPGGFDNRGVEGKIYAARFARENNLPYFGICLGMQIMIIEFARNVLKLKDANSEEFELSCKNPVIELLEDQTFVTSKGGSMRLGAFPCHLKSKTKAANAYAVETVLERHRHRYEFNNKFKKEFENNGMVFSGIYKNKNLVEISELKDHKFMLGVQFHPEFLSSYLKPHPLFVAFIESMIEKRAQK